VRRLLEYERMKDAARQIDALPLADRDFATVRVWFDRIAATRLPEVRPEDLRTAWAALIARARSNRHHLITREQLSVRAEMARMLKALEPARYAEFTALFSGHADVPHLVVTFLALLELAREQLVSLAQAGPYAPIYVHLNAAPGFELAPETGAG
jgi:segregation and condensation protein A